MVDGSCCRAVRRLVPVLLCVAFLCAGCGEPKDDAYTWGPNGLEAPDEYSIAPEQPRVNMRPGDTALAMNRQPQPILPPMPMRGAGELYTGVQPLQISVGRDFAGQGRPFGAGSLDPGNGVPVEQLIFGGVYGERGASTEYRYASGDKLRVTVVGHEEFDGIVGVADDGMIRIPNTQDYIKVVGLDESQVAVLIAKTVRPYVRKTPVVRVSTQLGLGGYYYVFGGVQNPGRYPIGNKPLRLSEAVFRADSSRLQASDDDTLDERLKADLSGGAREGFKSDSGLRDVDLITPHRSHPLVEKYNVAEALLGGRTEGDPYVKPGQIIIVRIGAGRNLLNKLDAALKNVVVSPTLKF